jgi:pimeloyl-ACP methyl ester carboxylesterase
MHSHGGGGPRPSRGLFVLETRALLELAACLPAYPFLQRAPRGDGHPVLVLPGLLASDLSTRTLRRFLRGRGYAAHGWKLGRNLGPTPELAAGLVERLARLRARYDRPVSIVGWSLGGIYARELARRFAADVRQVITLASPFRDVEATNVPAFLRGFVERRPLPDQSAYRAGLRLAVPDESSDRGATGYFGADVPLLPDALNPLRRWFRLVALAGIDTGTGWGVGAGLYGQGKLAILGCNLAHSSRPVTEFLGERVAALAVTCSAGVPL